MDETERPRIGVSSCLLGEQVRYDGGHARSKHLLFELGPHVQWVPVCPEVEMGLGAPREAVRLTGDPKNPNLKTSRTGIDLTLRMNEYTRHRLEGLQNAHLAGYVLKAASPTCGLFRVKVYNAQGIPDKQSRGKWAAAITKRFPQMPVEEDGRLRNHRIREHFLERVFAYQRWNQLLARDPRPRDLVEFHARHKMTLLSHDRAAYERLGRLVAQAGTHPFPQLLTTYGQRFMQCLATQATPAKHVDAMLHLHGHVKNHMPREARHDLVHRIEQYRKGYFPLAVPMTLLVHHVRLNGDEWARTQTYLRPYPAELGLRSHV